MPKDDDADDAEDTGPKVLSKKEKEKLKKEREKVCLELHFAGQTLTQFL